MQPSANRSIVIIAGLLTFIVLGSAAFAVALHNGWLQPASDTSSRETVAASAQPIHTGNDRGAAVPITQPTSAAPTHAGTQDEARVYRRKLEEAYRALDDAYTQIRALQSPQAQLVSARNDDDRFTEHDGDDDRREHRSGRRESQDE